MTTNEKLQKIVNKHITKNYHEVGISISEAMNMVEDAYSLGMSSKRVREDENNPYNIDFKRQTKIEF